MQCIIHEWAVVQPGSEFSFVEAKVSAWGCVIHIELTTDHEMLCKLGSKQTKIPAFVY